MEVTIWNEKSLQKDDFLGLVSIPLTSLCDQMSVKEFYKLRNRYSKDQDDFEQATISLGEVELIIQYKYKEVWSDFYKSWICLKNNDFKAAIK